MLSSLPHALFGLRILLLTWLIPPHLPPFSLAVAAESPPFSPTPLPNGHVARGHDQTTPIALQRVPQPLLRELHLPSPAWHSHPPATMPLQSLPGCSREQEPPSEQLLPAARLSQFLPYFSSSRAHQPVIHLCELVVGALQLHVPVAPRKAYAARIQRDARLHDAATPAPPAVLGQLFPVQQN